MDTQKVKKRFRLKGSVLYTVTLVMMVMLILMMSAIALAGTANKRAYSEYHDDQTTYTGRSVIDSVVKTLGKGQANESLGTHIATKLINKPSEPVVVNVNDKEALPDGYGTVEKLEFTYVGKDAEDDFYINGSGYNIFKVTATVKMGNETTTYSEYVCGVNNGGGGGGGGAGFLASNNFSLGGSTGATIHGPSYTLTLPKLDASGNVVLDAEGNIQWPDAYKEPLTDFRNDAGLSGGGLYGSTLRFTTGNSVVSFQKNINGSNGLSVSGNIAIINPTAFLSEYKPVYDSADPDKSDSITNIPYIYCDGTFYAKVNPYVGALSSGSDPRVGNPINIYAGRILSPENDGTMYSSIYCYNSDATYSPSDKRTAPLTFTIPNINAASTTDEVNTALDGKSPISVLVGNGNGTKLLDWASGVMGDKKLQTGNIYTKGHLKLGTDPTHKFEIKGDICVEQVLDMTNCSYGSSVYGNICVNGQLMVKDAATFSSILKDSSTVTCRQITDAAGNNLKDAAELSGKITIKDDAFTWPTGMSKDDILGKNDKSYKIIQTQNDAFESFYDVKGQKFKRSENNSCLDVSGTTEIYYYDNNEVKMRTVSDATAVSKGPKVDISKSCTIAGGTFKNCTFNITPPAKSEIWINLYDVKFSNCNIIVDDSDGREVYFYIPQGDNYSSTVSSAEGKYFEAISNTPGADSRTVTNLKNTFYADNTHFLTKNYNETYFGGGESLVNPLNLKTYYKKDEDQLKANYKKDEDQLKANFVPDLYICAADNKTKPSATDDKIPDPDTVVTIDFSNQCVLTGHIIALDSNFSWANSSHKFSDGNFSYTLEGATKEDTFSNKNISVIGSIFVANIKQIQNTFQCFYVDYFPEGTEIKDVKDKYSWETIDGYVSY